MATYKGIQGYTVQNLSADPSPAQSVEGQLWYNSAVGKWKLASSGAGAWASGGARNNPYYDGTGCGIQTAALACFGAPSFQDNCEEYNGISWAEVTAGPTALSLTAGGGIQTSAVFASGTSPALFTESFEYDGTNWTEGGDITSGRKGAGGSGASSTAALIFGGEPPGPAGIALTEKYDGSTWTETGDLNQPRYNISGLGITTATLACAGSEPQASKGAYVEEYNGTTWSEKSALNTARHNAAQNGAGTTTAALVAGGTDATPGVTGKTEVFDGSTWTEVADLATARASAYGGGTQTAAIVSDGGPPYGGIDATEEWADPVYSIQTVTVS